MQLFEVNPHVRFCANQKYFSNMMYCGKSYLIAYDSRMLYCLSGSGKVEIAGQMYEMKKDSLLIFRYALKYKYYHNEKKDMECISANFDYDYSYANKYTYRISPDTPSKFDENSLLRTDYIADVLYVKNASTLKSDVLELYRTYHSLGNYKDAEVSARMKVIVVGAYALSDNEYRKDNVTSSDLVESVCEYIDRNAEAIKSGSEVAEVFSYHAYYINNLFKKNLGYTLHNYIIKAKINRSIDYLLTTPMSISDIAERCGFFDSAHFSRHFKRITGNSPAKFRYI